MPEEEHFEQLQVPLVWTGTDEVPIQFVNQILGQIAGPEEIVLAFGQVTPPPLLGSPEERREQASQITYVPVQIVARVSLTRSRLAEFHRVIGDAIDNYDKMIPGETT